VTEIINIFHLLLFYKSIGENIKLEQKLEVYIRHVASITDKIIERAIFDEYTEYDKTS